MLEMCLFFFDKMTLYEVCICSLQILHRYVSVHIFVLTLAVTTCYITFSRPAFLKAAENFTLLVKNNIWYPKFNFSK